MSGWVGLSGWVSEWVSEFSDPVHWVRGEFKYFGKS